MAGDPTPGYYGRVTLNLFKHFEPTGAIMILISSYSGFGLGWGNPAPMDPRKMRNPRWDFFIAVIAGPLSNLLQAVVYAAFLRFAIRGHFLEVHEGSTWANFPAYLLFSGVLVNISLFLFNLIPFGPLDGHWLLGLLLPEKQRILWFQFNRRVGFIGLFLAIIVLQRAHISPIEVPATFLFKLLTGLPI